MKTISEDVWAELVESNRSAVRAGWAQPGVFAAAVGPDYRIGEGFFYIGKSAGPLGSKIGSAYDQKESSAASVEWMIEKRNNSPFWKFAEKIDHSRKSVAWSNLCKMDKIEGDRPPDWREWPEVSSACMKAIAQEMRALRPKVTVFATSDLYKSDVDDLLDGFQYRECDIGFDDRYSRIYLNPEDRCVITTKHPQGWNTQDRDRVIDLVKARLAS